MVRFSLLFLTILIIGCARKTEKLARFSFYVQDSLYKISFEKPSELDTFYEWEYVDCVYDQHMYRFSKKSFPIEMESGSFSGGIYADSTYYITFKHLYWGEKYRPGGESYLWDLDRKSGYKDPHSDAFFSKYIESNGHKFAVMAYRDKLWETDKFWSYKLRAQTIFDSTSFTIFAESRSSDTSGFIEKMEKTLKTVSIEKGK